MKLTQSLAYKLKWTMRTHVVYQILFISYKFYTFDWPRMSTISKPPNSKKAFNNRGLNKCTHHNQLQWFSALKLGFWQNPYTARCICEYTAANTYQPAKQRRIGNEYTHTSYIVILGPSQKPLLVFCVMIYRRQILALNLKEWWLQNRGIHFSTANLLCIGCWVALKKSP